MGVVVGEVLYRKWRSQRFAEVAGQEPVTRTLRNSVASKRLAHAYLFCGPRGTGKTSLGRLLAKAANCSAPVDGEPCNECEYCVAFNQGRAMDFIEQDAASHNSVDDIRQLRENVVLTPMSGIEKRKVYLLDEVHMLSTAAANALLKTLEEPPPHIIFVLATTDPHKVPATIISRCQRFDLRRIPLSATVERLRQICQEEDFTLDEASLEEIGRSATGSLRDAVNALEQVVTYYGTRPSFEQVQEALGRRVDARSGELARLALSGDLAAGLKLIASVRDDGADMRQFCRQVVNYLRALLLAKAGAVEALDMPREATQEMKSLASSLERSALVRVLWSFVEADFRDEPQSSLPLELALLGSIEEQSKLAPLSEIAVAAEMAQKSESEAEIPVKQPEEVASTSPVQEEDTSSARGPAAAQPADGGGARDGSDLLEMVRQACRQSDRQADKQLAALLNGSCEVKSAEGDVVVLGFYHTFHLERVESGSFAPNLDEWFSKALGRTVRVVYEHAPRERTAAARVKSGHLVQAARELGARPIVDSAAAKGGQDDEPRRNEPGHDETAPADGVQGVGGAAEAGGDGH